MRLTDFIGRWQWSVLILMLGWIGPNTVVHYSQNITSPAGGGGYEYDPAGQLNVKTIHLPTAGKIQNTYDALGRVASRTKRTWQGGAWVSAKRGALCV
jgi:hypothetical protein